MYEKEHSVHIVAGSTTPPSPHRLLNAATLTQDRRPLEYANANILSKEYLRPNDVQCDMHHVIILFLCRNSKAGAKMADGGRRMQRQLISCLRMDEWVRRKWIEEVRKASALECLVGSVPGGWWGVETDSRSGTLSDGWIYEMEFSDAASWWMRLFAWPCKEMYCISDSKGSWPTEEKDKEEEEEQSFKLALRQPWVWRVNNLTFLAAAY